jgi:hypothetical protein
MAIEPWACVCFSRSHQLNGKAGEELVLVESPMKYWEIIADKLSAAGWSWGYCSDYAKWLAMDC